MAVSPQQVITKYLEDRGKIRAIRAEAQAQIDALETFQAKREEFLLAQDAPEIFEFFVDLYLHGRDGKAEAEKKKSDCAMQMDAIEKWLLKQLDKLKSKGFKTEFGTVYPTKKESVTVEDWDAFVDAELFLPAAQKVYALLDEGIGASPFGLEELSGILRSASRLEFINKGANKSACLEQMGEKDDKTESRPNPPPPGIKYVALRTVGVRKK